MTEVEILKEYTHYKNKQLLMKQLLNYREFKVLGNINEMQTQIKNELEFEETFSLLQENNLILESFSSKYMQMLMDSFPKGQKKQRYSDDFQTLFYASTKINLGQIQDTDFTVSSDVKEPFSSASKKSNKIFFMVNDQPDFLPNQAAKGNKPPYMISIIYHGKLVFSKSGLRTQKKTSTRLTIGDSNDDRWGWYSSDGKWDMASKLGVDEYKTLPITQKNVKALSTKVYSLDLDSLKQKYSTVDLVNKRAEAKKGALAFADPKKIKEANIARYKKAIANDINVSEVYKLATDIMNMYNSKFKEIEDLLSTPDIGDVVQKLRKKGYSKEITKEYNWDSPHEKFLRKGSNIISNVSNGLGSIVTAAWKVLLKYVHIEQIAASLAVGEPYLQGFSSEKGKTKEELLASNAKDLEYLQYELEKSKDMTDAKATILAHRRYLAGYKKEMEALINTF